MTNLDDLKTRYKAKDQELNDLERVIVHTKRERSDIAKEIHAAQGNRPFDFDGREVTVLSMKGFFFLHEVFKPGGPKKETPEATT